MSSSLPLLPLAKLYALFAGIEILSLLTFNQTVWHNAVTIILSLIIFGLTIKKPIFGLWILISELILGGKGYLFKLNFDETIISFRMIIFIIVFSVWLSKFIIKKNYLRSIKEIFGTWFYPYLALLAAIGLGFFLGFKNNHAWDSIFFDGNGYFYFLLAPLFLIVLKEAEEKKTARWLWLALALWLAVKTIILFIVFHYLGREGGDYLYRFVRQTGVGEITWLSATRVFLQSQIFIVAAWLAILVDKEKTKPIGTFSVLTLLGAAILISLSRSFWAGLGLSIGGYFLYLFYKKSWIELKQKVFLTFGSITAAALLIFLLSGASLSPRVRITEDAGASSRRAQWPILLAAIKNNPLGYGFGKNLTYKTSDPRLLKENPSGLYTTYSFELGWLDIVLKLGFFGLAAYLWIFWTMLKNMRGQPELYLPIVALFVIHFLTPYLGHPLGIGLLLLISGLAKTKNPEDK